jgi:phosphomannomutase
MLFWFRCLVLCIVFGKFSYKNMLAQHCRCVIADRGGWPNVSYSVFQSLRPNTLAHKQSALVKATVFGNMMRAGGGLVPVDDFYSAYRRDLASRGKISRKLRVAAVCGNGTAGAFAPQILRDLGCEVIEIDCQLDHSFPNYNPNPEDLEMLDVMVQAVRQHKLDLAFGFDGDGDRCGVADNEGNIIFADKIGLMLARDIAARSANAKFVVDVKSTGLFKSDPVLKAHGATVDYWKTGHSYIKQREKKYGVLDQLVADIERAAKNGDLIAGGAITDINTVNGVRFGFDDGSWGLIRASSNKPELVVVCESLGSELQMRGIFHYIEGLLAHYPAVGAFNQKI